MNSTIYDTYPIGSALGQTLYDNYTNTNVITTNAATQSVPLPTARLVRLMAYGAHPHPALEGDLVELLLQLADSSSETERLAAVCHRATPLAKVVMMQQDASAEVADIARRIVQHSDVEVR